MSGGGVLAGISRRDAGVEFADGFHVSLDVPRGEDGGSDAADFAAVVEVTEHDGYLGALGNVIKAALPFFGLFTCAFGGDQDNEFLVLAEGINDLIHDVVGAASIDGHAAKPFHDGAEWPPKVGVLHHPIDFHSEPEGETKEKEPVPVARMRGGHDDVFGVTGRFSTGGPPGETQKHAGQGPANRADDGCVANVSSHRFKSFVPRGVLGAVKETLSMFGEVGLRRVRSLYSV